RESAALVPGCPRFRREEPWVTIGDMKYSPDLPLMRGLRHAELPSDEPLVLASSSPRRAQLLSAAGYEFSVLPAGDEAECGICSRETAPQLVARYAFRKAADVATQIAAGSANRG